jgi:quinoprotein glucose dehydrogenase
MSRPGYLAFALATLLLADCSDRPENGSEPIVERSKNGSEAISIGDWPNYGQSLTGLRYSALTEITPENVGALEVAWTYHIGKAPKVEGISLPTLEATPIVADGRMYLCSSVNRLVALDPETGRELWSHDPKINLDGQALLNCRGVTYYRDDAVPRDAACGARIFMGTQDARLISLDAATGRPCEGFGVRGEVDLATGREEFKPGEYGVSSPPVIVGRNLIVGGRVADNVRLDIPAGLIRAFDVDTGALVWAWNPVPPGRPEKLATRAGEVYVTGTTNSWTVMSADVERGLVYVPTGNTSPDFFGGLRDGLDFYSSSVVALDAATGKAVWHFQTVHHDLWDYDVPAQPVLFDLPTANGTVPALAQPTKQGHLFVLNRVTGEPLFPVEERAVPQTVVAGETPAPTQPFPVDEAFVLRPDTLTEDDIWGFTPWDRAKCREKFRTLRYEGMFTPPSLEGTLMLPSFMGAMNWGSAAVDEARGVLVVNKNNVAAIVRLVPRADADARMRKGEFMVPAFKTPYAVQMEPMLSPLGAPCNPPPWGTLVAIDLKSRKRLWEVPLGSTRDLAPFPLWLELGVPNIGGPVITASGLVFIGAATDNYLRAFDLATGELLWKGRLPAGGQATPMTYRLRPNGKQYVVIAAGGHKYLGTRTGDSLVAFALPD